MKLEFRTLPMGEMERDPTQRDQFNNDDVQLVEALVRESIQNSLDASAGGLVSVRFGIATVDGDAAAEAHAMLDTAQLNVHLELCGLPAVSPGDGIRTLVIEDFGTTGLQGSWDTWDQGAFCDFWRRMGKSHKGGRALGRWGLGKLVFSSSSDARLLMGLTARNGESEQLLMGQVVLKHHALPDGSRVDSHGFYCELGVEGMQLPLRDSGSTNAFGRLFKLYRTKEPGLSVVIPFLKSEVDEQSILRAVVSNYFVPILFGRLAVHVAGTQVNTETYSSVARDVAGADKALEQTIGFVAEISQRVRTGCAARSLLSQGWPKLSTDELVPDLAELRQRFQNGEICEFRAPIQLKRKGGAIVPTYFDVYLKKCDLDVDALFVRRSIVLSAEKRYFRGRNTLCVLIADDDGAAEFLADAENPAHTGCSASAEKVVAGWMSPRERLKEIRDLPQRLYSALNVESDITDASALIDIFSVEEEAGLGGSGKGSDRVSRPALPKNIVRSVKPYRIASTDGGFAVVGDATVQAGAEILVSVAYDIVRGDPFLKQSALDFDLSKDDIDIALDSVKIAASTASTIRLIADGGEFRAQLTGFDPNRDLAVKAESAA